MAKKYLILYKIKGKTKTYKETVIGQNIEHAKNRFKSHNKRKIIKNIKLSKHG